MSDETDATAMVHEYTGKQTAWDRCDSNVTGERWRFEITNNVLIWFRPEGTHQARSEAVAALRTLAAKASELADEIETAKPAPAGE